LFPWVPLGLAGAVLIGLGAGIFFTMSGPQASAAVLTPEAAAGFQTTDKLALTINLPAADGKKLINNRYGNLTVELLDQDGKIIDKDKQDVGSLKEAKTIRFEFAAPKVPTDQVTVRCRFDGNEVKVPLNKILLVKAHETSLTSGQEFYAGTPAALRCEVHGVKSYTETVPLRDASVEVRLVPKEGKAFTLYSGKADKDGVAAIDFKVPAVPAGKYKLEVATESTLGKEKLEREVTVKATPKVLLVTDKPLYQPGQLMHIRALALQGFDLTPVAEQELVFEVEDAKGNKVFKQSHKTSPFGIAAVDFQLADEVNNGDYHIRAILGEQQSDKTVTVKPYVLPKFKNDLSADKKFYLPKETIHAELQTDYFFGKPVAGGKIKVTASTFDVAFKEFQTWDGKTDAQGHVKFDIKLPDYFVGQPLANGNALVRLEVKVTDTADHTETISKTFPVSDQSVRVSLIPEGGRLIPGMENRIFAAALYPDGSPAAKCEVNLWRGQKADGKPFETVKTNEAGLAEFRLTPEAKHFRQGNWGQRQVEMLGAQPQVIGVVQALYDLFAEVKDAKGNKATATAALTSEPLGENVLLRLDKAVYKGGESLKIDVRSSAGLPTVFFDVIKGGQTLLTKWLDVKDGKADYKLDLPPTAFGTLEVHAYQMLASGEIIRDSRVVYVHPASDLKIQVKADKDVYLPGAEGKIRFEVTDAAGKPTAAALGVLIVDEAVYALQEMQPGLEKVYFTLQEELLKPQAQVVYKPGETIDTIVRDPVLPEAKQQIAEVLLTAVRPKVPARWTVDPVTERRQKLEQKVAQIGWTLYSHAFSKPFMVENKKTGAREFKPGILDEVVKEGQLDQTALTDPVGGKLTLEALAKVEKNFTPDNLARAITAQRMQSLTWAVANYSEGKRPQWFKDGKWTFPETILKDAAKNQGLDDSYLKDAWGNSFKLVKLEKKRDNPQGQNQFDFHELVSAGPDGKFDTADDVKMVDPNHWQLAQVWWLDDASRQAQQAQFANWGWNRHGRERVLMLGAMDRDGAVPMRGAVPGGFGGGGPFAPGAPVAANAAGDFTKAKLAEGKDDKAESKPAANAPAGEAPAMRLREYFPETLLWKPALITDDKGVVEMPLMFADSITTWRLTASASSRGGSLGGVTAPLRVFQDFFVDLDLPVALTQNDEVAFPVAVYNYLKEKQTVKLDLQEEPWFELTDGLGLSRSLDLAPNEVTSVKFRIRAKKIGHFPLTVKARGSKMSDAIKRAIDVVPDGQKVEQVVTDQLKGKVTQTVTIPPHAIPDASKLFVKVYPGVMSQVLEGTEGMLRLPGG
jgi:hypothetical protein